MSQIARLLWLIRDMIKRRGVVSSSTKHQAGGPPLAGCPRLFIQCIRSYPPYLQAVPPSATLRRAMAWWQGPTYHCDRDPLMTVTGTHLSRWQGPTYHCERDPLITVTGTHLSRWQGPTYHCERDPLIADLDIIHIIDRTRSFNSPFFHLVINQHVILDHNI
jgi:hypothetical protein